jgi:hypothetical protein
LLIFIGGTLFYRITSSYTDFLALGSSLAKFSIFWKILVFVIAFLLFYVYLNKGGRKKEINGK